LSITISLVFALAGRGKEKKKRVINSSDQKDHLGSAAPGEATKRLGFLRRVEEVRRRRRRRRGKRRAGRPVGGGVPFPTRSGHVRRVLAPDCGSQE